jgi:hypothetical protein
VCLDDLVENFPCTAFKVHVRVGLRHPRLDTLACSNLPVTPSLFLGRIESLHYAPSNHTSIRYCHKAFVLQGFGKRLDVLSLVLLDLNDVVIFDLENLTTEEVTRLRRGCARAEPQAVSS